MVAPSERVTLERLPPPLHDIAPPCVNDPTLKFTSKKLLRSWGSDAVFALLLVQPLQERCDRSSSHSLPVHTAKIAKNKTELENRRVHIYALTLGIPGEMRIFPPLFVPSSLSLTAAGQEMAVFRRQDPSALHFHRKDHNWSVPASASPGSATERRDQVSTELACQGGGQLEMYRCDFPRNHLSSHRQTYLTTYLLPSPPPHKWSKIVLSFAAPI